MEKTRNMNTTPRARASAAAIALASSLALAACGGSDNAQPPATSAAVVNTAPSTILPPATTPAPTTTEAPAAPETTEAAVAPETTAPFSDEEQAKQEVIEAAEHAWYVFNEAKLDPTNDDKVQAALMAHTGEAKARVEEIIRNYRDSNRRSIPSDIAPANVVVYADSTHVDLTSGTATIELCNLGSNVMVEVGGEPDGSDRVLDDSVTAYDTLETYTLVDGEWLNSDGQVLRAHEGSLTCDAQD